MNRRLLLILNFAILCFVFISETMARPAYFSQWQTFYSESDADTAGCQLCHQNSGGGNGWNSYGWRIREEFLSSGSGIESAFVAVQNEDSDADPTASTNLAEINANSQPGWTAGAVNTIFFNDDTTLLNQLPPDLTPLDPEPVSNAEEIFSDQFE